MLRRPMSSAQSRTALVSIGAATLLVLLKLVTGIVSGSLGLVSAGIESSGDVGAAVMTFFALRLGGGRAGRGVLLPHEAGGPTRRRVAPLGARPARDPGGARRGPDPLRRRHVH